MISPHIFAPEFDLLKEMRYGIEAGAFNMVPVNMFFKQFAIIVQKYYF
jgi:hypothetical protein